MENLDINSLNNREFEFLMTQYQVLSEQQINHNSLVWSTPSLLFVAQAFLWGAALSAEINIIIRCCISFASILIGFAAVHGFLRNRLMEIADCDQLYAIENLISNQNSFALTMHCQLEKRTILNNTGNRCNMMDVFEQNDFYKKHKLSHHPRTFIVWEIVLWVFFGFSIALFIYNLILCRTLLPEPELALQVFHC